MATVDCTMDWSGYTIGLSSAHTYTHKMDNRDAYLYDGDVGEYDGEVGLNTHTHTHTD